jgi:hypothetical protein
MCTVVKDQRMIWPARRGGIHAAVWHVCDHGALKSRFRGASASDAIAKRPHASKNDACSTHGEDGADRDSYPL